VVVGAAAVWGWGLANGQGPRWVAVARQDLVLGVEVAGTLKALDTVSVGPPQVREVWDFKISFMASEGSAVKAGDPVLAFDASSLQQQLQEKTNTRDAARKEIEQKRANLDLARQDDELHLATAQANLRKARLKLERPDELVADKEIAKAKLDLALAEREVTFVTEKIEMSRRAAEAEIAGLQDTARRAALRVAEIESDIREMNVKAPRAGTVIYVSSWRDEKKKVGDTCWRAERVLELPDLSTMIARGEVDEAEAGKVAAGQRATFRLDSHPDQEYVGRVTAVTRAIERKAAQSQLKVVRMDIRLERTDRERMRPGMRLRGTLEVGRVPAALVVPQAAVSLAADGPVVMRRTPVGGRVTPVRLGKRNDAQVEILFGLQPGDLVAERFPTEAP
jgi:HlyD family secretion protein